jgi:Domain of unknown function (DUF4431)
MKHLFATLAAALVFMAGVWAQSEERDYGRATLYGTLTVYHPHTEEASINHDYFLLKLDVPLEVEIENWDAGHNGEPEKAALPEIQIIDLREDSIREGSNYSLENITMKALVGKKVMVEGALWPANTWHHITPLLISIDNEGSGTITPAERPAPSPSPSPKLPPETKAPQPAATPEIASGIDRTMENAEAANSPYRRLVKAAAAECVERYGKKVADNLNGVQVICAEYYDATVEEEGTTEGTSAREAENDFYTATLAHLSKLGTIPATVYQKEAARMAAKWSR